MRRISLALIALCLAAPRLALADDMRFYGPTWADSSGKDGKGGVSIVWDGNKRQFLLRPDSCKEKIDAKTYGEHPNWVLFDSEGNNDSCLSFEFTWVTTATDKHWDKKWSGGGLAFNNSWSNQDFSGAKYLVFYAKTNSPGVDFNLALTGDKDNLQTGNVKLTDYAEGKAIGEKWTRVVIPIASFPNLTGIDLTQVKTLRFDLQGDYPENKPVYVHFDKIFMTDTALVTPVENLGWLRVPGGVMLMWDKANDEGIQRYLVTVDGKVAGQAKGANKRQVKLQTAVLAGVGPHVVGVAADSGKQVSSYESVTVTAAPTSVETASVSIAAKLGHPISPYLWGFNYQDSESLKKLGATVNRWGGNDTTGYNWKDDADNHGSDWVFLNTGGPVGIAEKNKRYFKFVQDSLAGGANPIITLPITGWIAKVPPDPNTKFGSYPLSLFPGQKAGKEPGLGEGEMTDGKKVWGNDPNYNYLPSTPELQAEWVKALIKDFGTSTQGGVKLYQMDNEPGLWRWTHRDICPKGIGYDELVDLNAKYAQAVKEADPGSQVVGWTAWGVMELAASNWDYMPGGEKGYQLPDSAMTDDLKWTDRKAHGDVPQVVFFLKEMAKRSKKAGMRLIDYLDFHGFPEVWGKDKNGNSIKLVTDDTPYDPVVCQKQFDALRIFWDPTSRTPTAGARIQPTSPTCGIPLWGSSPR